MAFRIQKAIVRGEITNEVPGVVTGRVWVVGRPDPIVLQLEGNCLRDLAGCSLTILNPSPEPEALNGLATEQVGAAGVMTASRKTRLPTVGEDEMLRLLGSGEPVPSRYTNCLFLEWFSHANGRVVIESDSCLLSVSEPRWLLPGPQGSPGRVTPAPPSEGVGDTGPAAPGSGFRAGRYGEDEDDDDDDDFNEDGFDEDGFDDDDDDDDDEDDFDGDEDDDDPLDEFAWELELREADRRADAFGHHPFDLTQHLGTGDGPKWSPARGEPSADREPSPPTTSKQAAPGASTARHHLTSRALDIANTLHRAARGVGSAARGESERPAAGDEEPTGRALAATSELAGRLSAALDGIASGSGPEPGFVIAMLKRALGPLNSALQACHDGLTTHRAQPDVCRWLAVGIEDLFALRSDVLDLMTELRADF
jgi:hypothetical protein